MGISETIVLKKLLLLDIFSPRKDHSWKRLRLPKEYTTSKDGVCTFCLLGQLHANPAPAVLKLMNFSVALLFFLVNIEVSIVGTSLISITDELHSIKEGGWVVTGYLITYTSEATTGRVVC